MTESNFAFNNVSSSLILGTSLQRVCTDVDWIQSSLALRSDLTLSVCNLIEDSSFAINRLDVVSGSGSHMQARKIDIPDVH